MSPDSCTLCAAVKKELRFWRARALPGTNKALALALVDASSEEPMAVSAGFQQRKLTALAWNSARADLLATATKREVHVWRKAPSTRGDGAWSPVLALAGVSQYQEPLAIAWAPDGVHIAATTSRDGRGGTNHSGGCLVWHTRCREAEGRCHEAHASQPTEPLELEFLLELEIDQQTALGRRGREGYSVSSLAWGHHPTERGGLQLALGCKRPPAFHRSKVAPRSRGRARGRWPARFARQGRGRALPVRIG